MGASKAEILCALENSMFEFPELPGQWETPTFTGLRAHATPHISHIFGNMVGVSIMQRENIWWLSSSINPLLINSTIIYLK